MSNKELERTFTTLVSRLAHYVLKDNKRLTNFMKRYDIDQRDRDNLKEALVAIHNDFAEVANSITKGIENEKAKSVN